MLNIAIVMGRLTADPELRYTPNNTAVVSFRLAVERNYKGQGKEKETDFLSVVAWRNTAEFIAKYFRKGSMMAVQGPIQTRSYTDRQGDKRTATEILAEQVYFGEGKKQEGEAEPRPAPSFSREAAGGDTDIYPEDDLPF